MKSGMSYVDFGLVVLLIEWIKEERGIEEGVLTVIRGKMEMTHYV